MWIKLSSTQKDCHKNNSFFSSFCDLTNTKQPFVFHDHRLDQKAVGYLLRGKPCIRSGPRFDFNGYIFGLKCSVIYWPKPWCCFFSRFLLYRYFFFFCIQMLRLFWIIFSSGAVYCHKRTHKQWTWFFFLEPRNKWQEISIIFHPFCL